MRHNYDRVYGNERNFRVVLVVLLSYLNILQRHSRLKAKGPYNLKRIFYYLLFILYLSLFLYFSLVFTRSSSLSLSLSLSLFLSLSHTPKHTHFPSLLFSLSLHCPPFLSSSPALLRDTILPILSPTLD